MPLPAIAAGALKVGAVIAKVAVGTAKGLAAGAKFGAKATASGAKSSGKLVRSSTKVRNNIVKSNKRIGKIKKNRQRLKKSISNERKRLSNERSLERKRTSNKIPGSGILNNPVIAGLKNFIYTLLFGLAITNIENIMKGIEKVKEMITGFIKFIVGIKDGIDNVISAFQGDNARIEKEKENFDTALGKMNDALDNVDTDGLLKKANASKAKQGDLLKGSDIVNQNQDYRKMDISTLETAIDDQKKTIRSTNPLNVVKSYRERDKLVGMNKRLEFLKWIKENNIDLNNLNVDKIKKDFNLEKINLSKKSSWSPVNNLTALNSSTNQDTVVINKTVVKKEYIPIPVG